MSVRKLLCTAVPTLAIAFGTATITGCHKDDEGHWKMGMHHDNDEMHEGHMSKEHMMKHGDELIMKGQEMKDKGVRMNDQKMQMDGQNMIDKGQKMKDDAMKM